MNSVIDAVTRQTVDEVIQKGVVPVGLVIVVLALISIYLWFEWKGERKRNRELQEARLSDLNTSFVRVMTAIETLQAGLEFVRNGRRTRT